MKQTRLMSLVETVVSTSIGFLASLALQVFLMKAKGVPFTLLDNLEVTLCFTALSLVRSYGVRRGFEYLRGVFTTHRFNHE